MSSESTTAVVLLGGGIFFKPASDAISATVTKKEELSSCLETKAEKSSIDNFHLIMQASSISPLFDADAIQSFVPLLNTDAEVVVHIMGAPGEEDVDTIKMALVLANMRIEGIQDGEGGAQILTAKLA